MISIRSNQGRHRSPSPSFTVPLPTPWPKLSLVVENCFTNLAVRPVVPRRHWVVLGSFTPCLYSGTLISLLFGLNDFTKSNIRISLSLSPGEPLITDDRLLHLKTLKILSADNPRTCVHRFYNSLSSMNSYG